MNCAKEDSENSKTYSSFSGPQHTLLITAGEGGRFNAAACPAESEDACRNIFHNSSRLKTARVSFPAGTYVTISCLLYTSPSQRDRTRYRMTSSA